MKAEVRDILGKAAYAATNPNSVPWEELRGNEVKELYCLEAEAVVRKLADLLVPTLITTLLTQEDMVEILTPLL